MCYSPMNIKDPKYNKEAIRITVPCGKCLECLQSKRVGWSFRLEQELKVSKSAYFVTLTYDNENLVYGETEPTLVKDDLREYIKSIRDRNRSRKIRYYACGEYGSQTQRPHYHLILFNVKEKPSIVKAWKKGFVHVDPVNPATINYVTKYLITKNIRHTEKQPEFSLMSKKLGYNYIESKREYHEAGNTTCRMTNGQKIAIPRYIKDRVWSEYDKKMYSASTQVKLEKYNMALEKHYKKMGKNPDQFRQEVINNRVKQFNKKTKKNGNI